MVRVAGLMGQAASGIAVRSVDGMTPRDALGRIREAHFELLRTFPPGYKGDPETETTRRPGTD